MAFLDLVRIRRSVRAYSDCSVEREKIERCLEAARLAPSACNSQPWHFIIVDDPALREKVAAATISPFLPLNRFVPRARVIVAVVAEPSNATAQAGTILKDRQFNLIDVGIAAQHFCLQAAEEGLGTCILGWFQERKIRKLLGVSGRKRIGLLITLGYPETPLDDENSREKKRKPHDEIRSYNGYGLHREA